MKRRLLALSASFLLLSLLPAPALAIAPTKDQTSTATGTWIPFGGSGPTAVEQTFVVGVAGLLTEVDVELKSPSTASVAMAIRATVSGQPIGSVLATATMSVTSKTGAFYHFTLSSYPSVKLLDILAIQIQTSVAGSYVEGSNPGNYALGELYTGSPIVENSAEDMAFVTWVTVMPSLPPPVIATPTPSPTPTPTPKPTIGTINESSLAPASTNTSAGSTSAVSVAPSESSTAGAATPSDDGSTTAPGDSGDSSGSPVLIILIVIVALALIGGGVALVLVKRRTRTG